MSELSSHTKLMNTIICLSTKSHRYCIPVLYQNHYELETIECSFNKIDGRLIDSDIVLKNPELNNLVILECKAGGLENDQAQRYASLSREDIVNANITTLNGNFKYQITYITNEENRGKLIHDITDKSLNFPVIVQNKDKLYLAHNSFSCEVLHNLFNSTGGISIPENPPLNYYPFGNDDSDAHILNCVAPVLIQLRGQEFTIEDLLFETHRIYEHISDNAIKSLKGRLGKLISDMSRGDMNEFFDIPQSKPYCLKDFGPKKFQKKIEKYIEKSDQKVLEGTQLSLINFESNSGSNKSV